LLKRNQFNYGRTVLLIGFLSGALGLLVFLQNNGAVAGDASKQKNLDRMQAYQVFQQKCLGCHVSVADPEQPGRTRDDWHLVVNVMHGYGLDLTFEQSEMIIDLLYDLRKGLEKEAG
jgi:hypothetical protein